jgi:hypothetical protein
MTYTVLYYGSGSDILHASTCSNIQIELDLGATVVGKYDDMRTVYIDLYGDLASDHYDPYTEAKEWLEEVHAEALANLIVRPCTKE